MLYFSLLMQLAFGPALIDGGVAALVQKGGALLGSRLAHEQIVDARIEDFAHCLGVGVVAREIPNVAGIGAEQIVEGDVGPVAVGHALARRYRARRVIEPVPIAVHKGEEIPRHLQLLGIAVVEDLEARGEGSGAAVGIGPGKFTSPTASP